MEGVSTAKIVLFHQGSTELRRCENCVFFLPVNILTGVTRRLLGPHDTLPCVLIFCQTDRMPNCLPGYLIPPAKGLKNTKTVVKQGNW